MIAMVIMPVVVRIAEKRGLDSLARTLAYAGYTWMGFLFLFFSISVATDVYRCLLSVTEKILHTDFSAYYLSSRAAFYLAVAYAVICGIYGYFEATGITSERVVVRTAKLPPEVKKFIIVQISDVHLGLIVRQERLNKILEIVKSAHPDMLVSTGDLVDGQLNSLAGLAELLQEVKPAFGKFAITGNHEFYAGLDQAVSFTEKAGFKLLRDDSVNVSNIVTIAGVDDPAAGWAASPRHVAEKALLSGLSHERYTVFLKHRPKVEPDSVGLFDLQLSGHVHKGQIFPFNLVTYLFYPVKTGFSVLSAEFFLVCQPGDRHLGAANACSCEA